MAQRGDARRSLSVNSGHLLRFALFRWIDFGTFVVRISLVILPSLVLAREYRSLTV